MLPAAFLAAAHRTNATSAPPRRCDPTGWGGPDCIPLFHTTQLWLSILLNFRMQKQRCLLLLVPPLCLSAEPTVYLLISGESLCVNIAVNSLASLPRSAAL